MSPVTLRVHRSLLLVLVALVPATTVAACGGGGGMSQSEIEQKVDAASVGEQNAGGGDTSNSGLAQQQADSDADQRAADEAVRRRKELEQIQADQKAETEKILKGSTPDEGISLDEQRFRARIAGVCEGAQSRITKVSKAAKTATKTKDLQALLVVAQDYNDALGDFLTALKAVDAPASERALYASWLETIDDLSANIRLQLVSIADKKAYAKLSAKTEQLTATFITQTAQLGVTCLSITG